MSRRPTFFVVTAAAVVALVALGSATPADADSVTRSVPVASSVEHVVVTPDGSSAVLLGFQAGTDAALTVLDVASGVQSPPVNITGPIYNLVMSPDGATAVVPSTNGTLSFVQVASGTVTTVTLGSYLFDAAFTPDGAQVYVTQGSSSILVVDVASRSIVRTISIDPSVLAYGIAATPNGAGLVVADIPGSKLAELSAVTGALSRVTAATAPSEVVISGDGTRAYSSSFVTGEVRSLDLISGTTGAIVLGGTGPVGDIALTPDGSRLYVPRGFDDQISIVDTATNTAMVPLITGVNSRGIAITADGRTAFISDVDTPALLVIAIDRAPALAPTAPGATLGAAYAFTATTDGSPAPVAVLTGTLPAGLVFDAATGHISGKPTELGVFAFSITATNGSGSVTQAYSLTVSAAAALAATGVSSGPLLAVAVALLVLGLALRRVRRVH